MKEYKRPVVSVDSGLAEGVYAASGASAVTLGALEVIGDWGNGNGQLKFFATVDSSVSVPPLTITVTYNVPIGNAWGGGSNAKVNGNTAVFHWDMGNQVPNPAELCIQLNGVELSLSNVKIVSYTYSLN